MTASLKYFIRFWRCGLVMLLLAALLIGTIAIAAGESIAFNTFTVGQEKQIKGDDIGELKALKYGYKWHDLNGDSTWQQPGEPGLEGWTIWVDYDDDGVVDADEPFDVTETTGYYEIQGIEAGKWKVREKQPAADTSTWFCSYPTNGGPSDCYYDEDFEAGVTYGPNNFGNWTTAAKLGTKFEDLEADGSAKETGEDGLGGWRIYVDYNNNNVWDSADEPSALTATDGSYSIVDIVPGQWYVREVVQDGWSCSYPNLPDDLLLSPVISAGCNYSDTFTSQATLRGNDFGNWTHAKKAGYKWEDRFEPFGEWDQDNEPALSGWPIELWDITIGTPVFVATANTNGSGYYEFGNLDPGKTYAVCELLSFSHVPTFPMASTTPPVGETIFACAAELGPQYGPYGYQFTANSGDEYLMNNFGNNVVSGCTYTQGYWKTHSEYGPADHPDDGWYTTYGPYPPGVDGPEGPILDGPDTLLFDSGLTWLEAFNTPPKKINAWFILAHQWMAAYLNYYNGAGAGGSDVVQWLTDGAALLDAYDGNESGPPLIPMETNDRDSAIDLANMLYQYNSGYTGPSSCY